MIEGSGAVPAAVSAAVADAHRREWAYVLAATVRITRDLDLAEECVQDAYAKALTAWASTGIPANTGAWLTTVARHKALDVERRQSGMRRRLPLLVEPASEAGAVGEPGDAGYPADAAGPPAPRTLEVVDDRLRLVFTCCHPALSRDAQIALTLRLLCGLSTKEVARAYLVAEATMAARITRAKKKIAAARIPYRVPRRDELPERLAAVLDVVHLVFAAGHSAPAGEDLMRRDLVERALDLARMLRLLMPDDADIAGLLALILLTDARRATRVAADGRLQLLESQDRGHWDRTAIAEGLALVREALSVRPPGRFALQAAIAAVHARATRWEETDWDEIVDLYDDLCRAWPSPVVALNRAVAIGMAAGPAAALDALDALGDDPQLRGYGYFHSARADFLRRLDRIDEAVEAYHRALESTANAVEREFLRERLAEVRGLGAAGRS